MLNKISSLYYPCATLVRSHLITLQEFVSHYWLVFMFLSGQLISHFFQLVCSGSCPETSDEISPLYSLWATFIGLYMANYVVERSSG